MAFSPGQSEAAAQFREPAERFSRGEIDQGSLSAVVSRLPFLTHQLLDTLAEMAQRQSHLNPRLGWALALITDMKADLQDDDLLLRGKAAWYLGRAANNYVRPQLAFAALQRAKTLFGILKDENWLAACDWQQHVLAWAQADLRVSAAEVQAALNILSGSGSPLKIFQHDCRLTLAYVQTLIGRYDESYENLEVCEAVFKEEQDQLGLIRCYQIWGNCLRRQGEFDAAITKLESSIAMAEAMPAPVEEALSLSQLANVLMKRFPTREGLQEVEAMLIGASYLFHALDLPFWEAFCQNGLSAIYIGSGRLSESVEILAYCRKVFTEYQVDAPLAEVLIGGGWLETYRANYERGLAYLVQAETISRQVGNNYMVGVSLMHLGEIYLEMGRYQQALRYLEQGVDIFVELGSNARLAECGLRLARCWVFLGHPNRAIQVLDRVESAARKAGQGNIFPYLYLRRADALWASGKHEDSMATLRTAVLSMAEFDDKTGSALAQRLLGERLCDSGSFTEGAINIEAAEKIFDQIGLLVEQAACRIAWGRYYHLLDKPDAAREAFQKALDMATGVAPDVVWQAQAGLAALAEQADNFDDALIHYRQMVLALLSMRQDIWQPALTGPFLSKPQQSLDRAILMASRMAAAGDVLSFVEVSKAQAMANLFQNPLAVGGTYESPELANLIADIRWRQERIRALSNGSSWFLTADLRNARDEIKALVKQYDLVRGRLERKNQSAENKSPYLGNEFDLDHFRQLADESLGENWLAVNYYLTGDKLICLVVDKNHCQITVAGYPGSIRLLFAGLKSPAHSVGHWPEDDLKVLGEWLLPDSVLNRLDPKTILIIVPHHDLHSLPWPAIFAGERPLVEKAVPVVVPSLQCLAILMERSARKTDPAKGLLLAVSDFGGRHEPLPGTIDEVGALMKMHPQSKVLLEEALNWGAVRLLADGSGLADYAFLHLASHGFSDTLTGRLSGLAFYDRDVWLDELWDCAPLPPLVTLSACSGSQSKLFDGDEQVGLATTCLAAGSRQVVASLWPVHDEGVVLLMTNFYSYRLQGFGTAEALAMAQREAVRSDKRVSHWAGFLCTGLPD